MAMKWKKLAAALLLAVLAVACLPPLALATGGETGDGSAAIQDLNRYQQELQKEIEEKQKALNNTVIEKNTYLQELKAINDTLDNVRYAIEQLNGEIAAAQENIDYTVWEIGNKQRDYDGRMAIFCNRLKEIYQYGDVDFLEVLLQSSSLTDFLTRFEYLSYIAANDQNLLAEVTALKTALESQKASLESQKASLETQKAALETKKQTHEAKSVTLAAAQEEHEALVAAKEHDEDAIAAALDAFEEESKKIAAQIMRLQSKGGTAPSALLWPAPASRRVTSEYGERLHPVRKTKSFHTGIDIGAGMGTEIKAAADGTVIAASYNSVYGRYMVVDHYGGMSTMYAHMSAFVAQEGDKVQAGDPIGKIGSTGISTGPHLHFEVRLNGEHTNPAPYLGL